jgi:hypothetical protein
LKTFEGWNVSQMTRKHFLSNGESQKKEEETGNQTLKL